MMIETRVLKQFIAVAEMLNFHRAAQQLHMSQPPLSVAIRQLEEKLDVTLFIRNRSGVKSTPAGEAFLKSAREILQALTNGINHAQDVACGMVGKLTISSVSIAGYPPLLIALRRFKQHYPQVELIIKEMPSAQQIKAVELGEIDLAFVRKPAIIQRNLVLTAFLTETILAVVPVDHPLANHSQIDLQTLAKENFVFTPELLGEGYHHQLIQLCECAGFHPHITQEAAQLSTLIALVSCGFGISLVPESVTEYMLNEKVKFLKINQTSNLSNIELFMLHAGNQQHKPHSALLTNFLMLFKRKLLT